MVDLYSPWGLSTNPEGVLRLISGAAELL